MNPELGEYAIENGDPGLLAAAIHHERSKFPDIFRLKHGSYADLPASRISEMMKMNSLESSSTQSLFSVVSKILEESIERKNGDIPERVASLLKLVVQEIEQRISKHAANWRKKSNFYKSREEKYQSKLRALEALTIGTAEENEILVNQLRQIKLEKTRIDEKRKVEEQDVIRLMREKDHYEIEMSVLKQEVELAKKMYEKNCSQLETQAKETKAELENKIMELKSLLNDSRKKVKELEAFSESKSLRWRRKEHNYKHFIDSHYGSLQELRAVSESIKKEVSKTKKIYSEEINRFGWELKGLVDAMELSLNALTGATKHNTIRIRGMIKKRPVSILINTGTTHSFIDQRLVTEIR